MRRRRLCRLYVYEWNGWYIEKGDTHVRADAMTRGDGLGNVSSDATHSVFDRSVAP
jgi:hypothetical protein